MRKILAVLVLFLALNAAAAAFADDKLGPRPIYLGDGFDGSTCADMPRSPCTL